MQGNDSVAANEGEGDESATSVVSKEGAPRVARRCPECGKPFSGEARFCPFDGDALVEAPDWNPAADALIGQMVDGRYEVVRVLGEGGMGTVYEVKHTALGRVFALKVLRREIAQDGGLARRFIQEAKAAAAIGHPNIVAVSDFGELTDAGAPQPRAARVPYFVMELLKGTTLARLLAVEGRLEPRRAARIVVQCASALAAAHEAGVIHRDVKPDNVFLVSAAGRPDFVKLLDFGVAKMAGAGRLTRHGTVYGTPHYMSPEQAAGHAVDGRSDVYALGVLLYECLAGRVPFEADTYMGVLTKHMFATPEPVERLVPSGAGLGALGQVVARCLAKEPADRYASMAELGRAIELALDDPEEAASAALRDDIARRGLTNVEWLGALSMAELRDRTLTADVCLGVFGASEKAARVVPNKVYDALACGRPVVTADTPGIREALHDGEDALLVPAADGASLAVAIERLLDQDERARLGTAALATYRRAFTPDAVAGALLEGLAGA